MARVLDALDAGHIAVRRVALGQAEDDYRRALAVEERAHGSRSTRLTRVLEPLARVLLAMDRLTDTEAVARRSLDLASPHGVATPS